MGGTCDLLLIDRIQQSDGVSPPWLHKTPTQQTGVRDLPRWLDKVTGHEKAHETRNCRRPLGPAGGIQPTASQNQGPQSYHGKKVNSSNKLNEIASSFPPSQVSRWEHNSVDPLTATLWDPEQRSQLSHFWTSDPQKVWHQNVGCLKPLNSQYFVTQQ